MTLVTNEPDPKFCIELGYMIMLNKPIIAVVKTGAKVPPKLVAVADEIVEWNGEDMKERLDEALSRVAKNL